MEGEDPPLALGGGPGQDPHAAAAKAAATLAEAERRQAEHESEVQKVDEPQIPEQAAAQTLQAAEAMHEASEAARALRASHLQACAEACAEGSHRSSRAPSAGSSARSSLSLVGGGNYSTRFSGVLPDHMPPESTPDCGAAAARRYSARP